MNSTALNTNILLQNRYRVLRQLGSGGMGAVYEAVDERMKNRVALKQVKIEIADNENVRAAFGREARILANLRHPSLPKAIDLFDEDDRQFLVMEFIPGDDLKALLDSRSRPFEAKTVLSWAEQLLDALAHLHRLGIVHRDIKPANIKLASDDNRIYLLDFGLAKGSVGEMTVLNQSVPYMTRSYAPPEQLNRLGTDARSDLYSLGATLLHLLAGDAPPSAENRLEAIRIKQGDSLGAWMRENQIQRELGQVFYRAAALDPNARFASADQMNKALREASARMSAEIFSAQPNSVETHYATNTPPQSVTVTAAANKNTASAANLSAPADFASQTAANVAAPVTDSWQKRFLKAFAPAFALALLMLGGIFYAAYRFGFFNREAAPVAQNNQSNTLISTRADSPTPQTIAPPPQQPTPQIEKSQSTAASPSQTVEPSPETTSTPASLQTSQSDLPKADPEFVKMNSDVNWRVVAVEKLADKTRIRIEIQNPNDKREESFASFKKYPLALIDRGGNFYEMLASANPPLGVRESYDNWVLQPSRKIVMTVDFKPALASGVGGGKIIFAQNNSAAPAEFALTDK